MMLSTPRSIQKILPLINMTQSLPPCQRLL